MAAKGTNEFNKRDIIPALLWIAIGLGVMIVSYRLSLGTLHSPGPGMLPFILGSLLLVISLPILIHSIPASAGKGEPGIWSGIEKKNVVIIVAALIAYALFLEKAGFLLTAFLFLLVLFWVFDPRRWILALGVSLLTAAVTYTLFVLILQVELPPGLFSLR
ncbi:MAG TPA: tripartite tricarboxylate transporter TctB family protein [Thermodesulfobacteriota bacterium]|nr:tripartite tricarboxylate transporter TctB family protein [Thermodesulfobacteriota bacterium]